MTAFSSTSVSMNQPTLQELVDRVMARNQSRWDSAKTSAQTKVESFQSREIAGEKPAMPQRLWHR